MPEALIRPELVQLGAAPADKTAAIRQAGQLLVAAGCIAPAYVQSLLAREQTANTYLGSGVAIPHGQIADRHLIERTGIAVLHPRLFAGVLPGFRPLAPILRAHLPRGELSGEEYGGEWRDIGTPERLAALRALYD